MLHQVSPRGVFDDEEARRKWEASDEFATLDTGFSRPCALYQTKLDGWVLHSPGIDPEADSWKKLNADKAARWLKSNGHELPPELNPEV